MHASLSPLEQVNAELFFKNKEHICYRIFSEEWTNGFGLGFAKDTVHKACTFSLTLN